MDVEEKPNQYGTDDDDQSKPEMVLSVETVNEWTLVYPDKSNSGSSSTELIGDDTGSAAEEEEEDVDNENEDDGDLSKDLSFFENKQNEIKSLNDDNLNVSFCGCFYQYRY